MSEPILIVDDEPNVRLMYRTSLAGQGYEIFEASSGEAALEQCEERQHVAAILDLRMPGMDGFELLEKMQGRGITTPVVFVTAFGDVPNAVKAMRMGAIDFLPKPPTPDQLRAVLNDIILRHVHPLSFSGVRGCDYYLRAAKRAINLRDFDSASKHLIKALDLDSSSLQAIHLAGVMVEMRNEQEHDAEVAGHAGRK
jgi:DNA-binding response OmpR family regulator